MTTAHEIADPGVWNYSVKLEVPIHRPAKAVWPHLIGNNKNRWTNSEYTTLAGKAGEVGEIFTHAHKFNGTEVFYEAIVVQPEKYLVLKITYKDNETGQIEHAGYDFFTLKEVAGATSLLFQQAVAVPLGFATAGRERATEEKNKRLSEFFQNLKAVAEEGTAQEAVCESRGISTMDWVRHTELTLAKPLREVWPVFKDMRTWYTKYSWAVEAGPPYEPATGLSEGQVLKLFSATPPPGASQSVDQFILTRITKVVPEREIVASLSGDYYDWKQYAVFYVWRFRESGAGTTICVDCYGTAKLTDPLSASDFQAYTQEHDRSWHQSWSQAFANLRTLLGSDS